MNKLIRRKITLSGKWFVLLAVFAFMVVYALGNPASSAWWLKCPLYLFTGWQCPFCGLQRQLHALLHLHFAEAWGLNPFLLLCYPYFLLLFFSAICPEMVRSPRVPLMLRRFFAFCLSDRVFFIFVAALLLWGVVRNVWIVS